MTGRIRRGWGAALIVALLVLAVAPDGFLAAPGAGAAASGGPIMWAPIVAGAELYAPGAGPVVQIAPSSLSFGLQSLGTQSMPQTVTLTNTGTLPLLVATVAFSGANPQQYAQTNTCTAAPVPPAGTCTVAVRFVPVAGGHRPASLSIVDNAPTSPQSVTLTGYATGPNTWQPTGSLTTGRADHTATRLTNGMVLVAGGYILNTQPIANAELYDPSSGTWTATGSMSTTRWRHTATLLPNGKVLVAGGLADPNGAYPLASAELYDPSSGTWTLTGSMHSARWLHTATLLTNGDVLVAGGQVGNSSAELYDPTTGTWTTTGSMTTARSQHTATLLTGGKVLVAGGSMASAELYDPRSGTWSPTGSMTMARVNDTATLLPDGRVLVAGGLNGATALASAELYDPRSGTWTATGSMTVSRAFHTATLLPDGRVLVAGGGGSCNPYCPGPSRSSAELYDAPSGAWITTGSSPHIVEHTATLLDNGTVLVAGGGQCSFGRCGTDEAEVYTPGPGPLVRLSPTALAFGGQAVGTTSAALTDTVLNAGTRPLLISSIALTETDVADFAVTSPCIGRSVAPGAACPVVVRFKPTVSTSPPLRQVGVLLVDNVPSSPQELPVQGQATGPTTWHTTGAMAVARLSQTATLLHDGKVLVAGGGPASAELYDPVSGTWTPTGSMSTGRSSQTATLLPNGRVLVAGGCCASSGYALSSAELYDPHTGTWTATGAMATGRQNHTMTLLPSGTVLVTGGNARCCGGIGFASAELYNPRTSTWTATGSMTIARYNHTATLLPDGTVLVAGGCCDTAGNFLASAEVYDPHTGTWSATGSMATGRGYHTATLLSGGKVLVASGCTGSESCYGITNGAELYDPSTRTWTATGSLTIGRYAHTATLLPAGQVLVAGGWTNNPCCGEIASAELYDPVSGTWTPTGSMSTPRVYHTATLLPNNKVLVAGGCNGGPCTAQASAEIYTPPGQPGLDPWDQHGGG